MDWLFEGACWCCESDMDCFAEADLLGDGRNMQNYVYIKHRCKTSRLCRLIKIYVMSSSLKGRRSPYRKCREKENS